MWIDIWLMCNQKNNNILKKLIQWIYNCTAENYLIFGLLSLKSINNKIEKKNFDGNWIFKWFENRYSERIIIYLTKILTSIWMVFLWIGDLCWKNAPILKWSSHFRWTGYSEFQKNFSYMGVGSVVRDTESLSRRKPARAWSGAPWTIDSTRAWAIYPSPFYSS